MTPTPKFDLGGAAPPEGEDAWGRLWRLLKRFIGVYTKHAHPDDPVAVSQIAVTGTPDATTVLYGDRWAVPPLTTTLPASAITAGTFGAGDYVFPANLDVTTSLDVFGPVTMDSLDVLTGTLGAVDVTVADDLIVLGWSDLADTFVSKDGLVTTATDGFLWLPTCAGAPTGVPTVHGNALPIVIDRTNGTVYVRLLGAWTALGGGAGALTLYPNSRTAAVDTTVAAGMSVDVVGDYTINDGFLLTLASDAVMAIH